MNNLIYSMPFSYFWSTRLRHGSIGFHAVFEWLAAVILVIALAPGNYASTLFTAFLAYCAFISIYEIGYLVNDLIVAPSEEGGRTRGPQGTHTAWILSWMVTRILAFILVTITIGRLDSPHWWMFFAALAIIFMFHNTMKDRELKAGTFLWLSWFRFMAPVIFAVPTIYLLGIGMACAMSYSAFRQFGYLDSKGLLQMPGRQRPVFRWAFFMWPLLPAAALSFLPEARGLVVLLVFYAFASTLGVITQRRIALLTKAS